jgi:tryptophan synthase beta chain
MLLMSNRPVTMGASAANTPGTFGPYGGRYVAETLIPALDELAHAAETIVPSAAFRAELDELLARYVGRPTPVSTASRLARVLDPEGARIADLLLKREDLCHTGAHKINNALGQVLLAKKMGKTRIIAETGAGQHGVATATAAALFGLPCEVYQGSLDVERQAPNVARMKMLGAKVIPVETGSKTLKDALSEALRDWVTNVRDTYYCVGSVAGPHPYPTLVAGLQRIIGDEARAQCRALGGQPDAVIACVGGGSNAIGIFKAFVDFEPETALYGIEAAGLGLDTPLHAATLTKGRVGVLHGARSYVLSDDAGQILEAHSVSAGLDYPGVGPEHALLHDTGRGTYLTATDDEALDSVLQVARTEGILIALETAHAFAAVPEVARREAEKRKRPARILVNVSGRGDKDLATLLARRGDRLEVKS